MFWLADFHFPFEKVVVNVRLSVPASTGNDRIRQIDFSIRPGIERLWRSGYAQVNEIVAVVVEAWGRVLG